MATTADTRQQAGRRRTFAIISHPDAGKTTLTEKFLLYGGALTAGAGSVKAKGERRAATSDWMELERKRGISVTSAVVQFPYRDRVLNLLDTPGHGDFSEDTYRVLSAVDAAVMVLDGAKGIETQTRKLFEVCRNREIPIVTFINKWDRPSRDPLELLDEIEDQLVLDPVPVTWPVGDGDRFRGLIDRRAGDFVRFSRTAGGATEAEEEIVTAKRAEAEEGAAWHEAQEAVELLDAASAQLDAKRFEAGELSPIFFGSALTNFGVRLLLDAIVDLAPAPGPRLDANGDPHPVDTPFSAVVFKVQSNMDPAHRDRMAFLRVCSGRFERGMTVVCGRTSKTLATKYAHTVVGRDRSTVTEAWPGDVIGLVNATELRVGDAVHAADGPVLWPAVPAFAPSSFRVAMCTDTSKPSSSAPECGSSTPRGWFKCCGGPRRRERTDPGCRRSAAVRRGRAPVAPRVRRARPVRPRALDNCPTNRPALGRNAQDDVRRDHRRTVRRPAAGPVREPLLAGPPPIRPPRAGTGPPSRRGIAPPATVRDRHLRRKAALSGKIAQIWEGPPVLSNLI